MFSLAEVRISNIQREKYFWKKKNSHSMDVFWRKGRKKKKKKKKIKKNLKKKKNFF